MRYISDKEYERRLQRIKRENDFKLKVQKLKEQRNKYKKKKITTSKLALWIMMAIMFQIVIFAQVVMWKYGDFSSLYVLIGIPAAMIPIVWKYFDKSARENVAGGITFQTAMRENSQYDDDEGFSNQDESGEDFPG